MMTNNYPHIAIFDNEVFIANPSNDKIKKLVYSTKAMLFWDDDLVHTDQPYFQIENINVNSMVKIEDVDPTEDGTIIYFLEELEYQDNPISNFKKILMEKIRYYQKTFFREENTPKYSIQECEQIKIKTLPGYAQKDKNNE